MVSGSLELHILVKDVCLTNDISISRKSRSFLTFSHPAAMSTPQCSVILVFQRVPVHPPHCSFSRLVLPISRSNLGNRRTNKFYFRDSRERMCPDCRLPIPIISET